MWKPFAISGLIGMACCAALSQERPSVPPAVSPEFEVATVRPSQTAGGFTYSTGVQFDPAQVRMTNFSLSNCILIAYGVKSFQVSGPDWIGRAFYDITAKMPAGAKQEQFPAMMRKLLEQRFQLEVHRESKVLPTYALVVASGGLKIHPSETKQGGAQWRPGHLGL